MKTTTQLTRSLSMNSTLILSGLALFATALLGTGCSSTGTTDVAMGATSSGDSGYICPLTGETLPCPKCCPLNNEEDATAGAETVSMAAVSSSDGEGYTCPITGEMLPCEKCCPLNKK
jgi:hypothetical protein